MDDQPPTRPGGASSLARSLEFFARDLLLLIRGVRFYPAGHPAIQDAAQRIVSRAPRDAEGRLAVAVTRDELSVGDEFVGGAGTRAAGLAAVLHERRIGRVVLNSSCSPRDLNELATLLGERGTSAEDLRRELGARGVAGLTVDPLDLEKIHAAATPHVEAHRLSPVERRRQVWQWLQAGETTPQELARMLESPDLWPEGPDGSERNEALRSVALLLAGLGERVEAAVELLPADRRAALLDRIAEAGRGLPTSDLVTLVATESPGGLPGGACAPWLCRDLDGERFVDLLAGLAALGERGTRRLAGVFRRLAPPGGTRRSLSLVASRLADGSGADFAQGVWKIVEEFLLRLEEDPFMAQEYSESLERIAESVPGAGGGRGVEIDEDPGPHLDWVFLGLAADGGRTWRERVVDRVGARAEDNGAFAAISYANRVDEMLPGLLGERPALVKELFRRAMGAARQATTHETRALVHFCRAHERALLGPALRALEEEQRIAGRRFLVEALSSFSPEATPTLVSRARAGPWYVTRNLVLVLSRQGGTRAVPVLRELAEHSHPKVRREASRALLLGVGAEARE
ncbi:MAG: HEAT repeat domain-containing protein [Deltaproteobacteria bacterium]|nr:HEAT repeat domain-containing protein [Deltaproteobacteria bacterium]